MFSEQNQKEMKKLCELYLIVKELIIFGEEIDVECKTNLYAINELRSCLDHLLRAFIEEYNISEEPQPEEGKKDYIRKQIDKSYGHLYRTAYDTLDLIFGNLSCKFNKVLDEYSNSTIDAIIPDYFKNASEINKMHMEIANIRSRKDVGNQNFENLVQYTKNVKKLGDYYSFIMSNKSLLNKHKMNEFIRQIINNALIPIIIALILTYLIPYIISRY